ncbi:MAG TPA: CoA-transferase [Candidatus Udaeobacter sp.]|nr:CoA-transferase [Candidatus Udaeobacter sp.]
MEAPLDAHSRLVIAAAREVRDGELVIVSEPLGRAALALARLTHAPRAIALHPAGRVAGGPAGAPSMLTDLQGVMSLLQQGRVDLGFLVPGEVDRFGNVNSTRLGAADGAEFLLAGGPTADIACLARRTVILVPEHRARLREELQYITGPGHGDGRGYRERVGLPPGGPSAIITDLGVLRFDESGAAYLASLHPGVTADQVRAATGFPLPAHSAIGATPPPTVQELNLLAEVTAGKDLTVANGQ